MSYETTTITNDAARQEENAVAFETLFDPLYAQRYRLVRVEIFPTTDPDTRDPRGVAILKNRGKVYTSTLWVRHGKWIFAQPVFAGELGTSRVERDLDLENRRDADPLMQEF